MKDASKIIAASKRSKGVLQVGHICRFNPRYRTAKQAMLRARWPNRRHELASKHPGRMDTADPQKQRPIVGDAVHDTDLMLWFTGDQIVSAYAQTVDVRGLKYPVLGRPCIASPAARQRRSRRSGACRRRRRSTSTNECRLSVMPASFISRTLSRTLASCRATSFIVQIPLTGRNSMEFAEGPQRGTRLFRLMRAEWRGTCDRSPGGRPCGASGDARSGGIRAHRSGNPHRKLERAVEGQNG